MSGVIKVEFRDVQGSECWAPISLMDALNFFNNVLINSSSLSYQASFLGNDDRYNLVPQGVLNELLFAAVKFRIIDIASCNDPEIKVLTSSFKLRGLTVLIRHILLKYLLSLELCDTYLI